MLDGKTRLGLALLVPPLSLASAGLWALALALHAAGVRFDRLARAADAALFRAKADQVTDDDDDDWPTPAVAPAT